MRPLCALIRHRGLQKARYLHRRSLLTLAIETSCDDTSVAVLEKHHNHSATLHFHSKITSDNRSYGGVHPIVAQESHQKNVAALVKVALQSLPLQAPTATDHKNTLLVVKNGQAEFRKQPDFVTVTRGPGMRTSLFAGIDTAKGLAVAWQVPLLGVNHMQAHALTPRLVAALESDEDGNCGRKEEDPAFPFLSLLVSGGHTMLVHSKSLCNHKILANTADIAVGDAIDKFARDILPSSYVDSASDVMYGRLLESFAFPDPQPQYNYSPPPSFTKPRDASPQLYHWTINPPYSSPGPGGSIAYSNLFSYSFVGSAVKRIMDKRPEMDRLERRALAQVAMAVSFEHLASRVLFALNNPEMKSVKSLVVSGGVASNQYLKAILRAILDAKGYSHIKLIFPPPHLCTDNAAMIAWTGIEMYEAGWRTELEALAIRKWSIDPESDDGGILGVDGWQHVNDST